VPARDLRVAGVLAHDQERVAEPWDGRLRRCGQRQHEHCDDGTQGQSSLDAARTTGHRGSFPESGDAWSVSRCTPQQHLNESDFGLDESRSIGEHDGLYAIAEAELL